MWKLPIAPMGFSHVLFCAWLAGRRCVHQQWHGELLIVHHHGQHSLLCACSRSKVPMAPMGFSHVLCLCLQGGGVFVNSGTAVTFSSCTITGNTAGNVRAHAQNFPSPRWENVICLVDMSISILIFYDGCCLELPVGGTCHLSLKLQKFPSPR